MKAISLKQPWANWISQGKKTIETRTWSTPYRGDLLICSSRSGKIGPRGYALCVVELYDIRPMEQGDESGAMIKRYPGAYAWFLRNIRVPDPIFQVKGRLRLYEIEIPENVEIKPKCEEKGCSGPGSACHLSYFDDVKEETVNGINFYCAEHATLNGYCWGCGEFLGLEPAGLCPNCR